MKNNCSHLAAWLQGKQFLTKGTAKYDLFKTFDRTLLERQDTYPANISLTRQRKNLSLKCIGLSGLIISFNACFTNRTKMYLYRLICMFRCTKLSIIDMN